MSTVARLLDRRRFLAASAAATVLVAGAHAQARPMQIGHLTLSDSDEARELRTGLHELGYVEGKTYVLQERSAQGDASKLRGLADELVAQKPDVIVAGWGTLVPQALKAATKTIPVLFTAVGDPVGAGLVDSIARPGGNVTGLSGNSTELKSRQLQLLLTLVPDQKVVGVFMNPDTPYTALAFTQLAAAAEKTNIRLVTIKARNLDEFTAQASEILKGAGATSLFVIEDPLASKIHREVIAEANRLKLPVMSGLPEYTQDGGVMSYGPNFGDRAQRVATYVDRVLKGAKPAELPVEQPTTFRLAINMPAAKALGITVPPSLLALADVVIE